MKNKILEEVEISALLTLTDYIQTEGSITGV